MRAPAGRTSTSSEARRAPATSARAASTNAATDSSRASFFSGSSRTARPHSPRPVELRRAHRLGAVGPGMEAGRDLALGLALRLLLRGGGQCLEHQKQAEEGAHARNPKRAGGVPTIPTLPESAPAQRLRSCWTAEIR